MKPAFPEPEAASPPSPLDVLGLAAVLDPVELDLAAPQAAALDVDLAAPQFSAPVAVDIDLAASQAAALDVDLAAPQFAALVAVDNYLDLAAPQFAAAVPLDPPEWKDYSRRELGE